MDLLTIVLCLAGVNALSRFHLDSMRDHQKRASVFDQSWLLGEKWKHPERALHELVNALVAGPMGHHEHPLPRHRETRPFAPVQEKQKLSRKQILRRRHYNRYFRRHH